MRCSSGILGMDFLQRVGAGISLTAQLLYMGLCPFPLRGQEWEVSEVQRLINAGQMESLCLDQEEWEVESVEDWEGTVELAETVTVTLFSVRIARSRVVRRNDSAMLRESPSELLLDPVSQGLPGIWRR